MNRYILAAISLVFCLQAEETARTVAAINPVHEPGVYGLESPTKETPVRHCPTPIN